VSNPKVFEYAKEIGMTPLALMDKIREWKLPVKSHMAELEPELLSAIKEKLNGSGSKQDSAAKKTAVRKKADVAPAKKPAAKAAAPKAAAPKVVAKSASSGAPKPVAKTAPKAVEKIDPKLSSTVVRRKAKADEVKPEIIEEAPIVEEVKKVEEAPAPIVEKVVKPVAEEPEKKVVVPARKKEVAIGASGISSDAPVQKRNIIGRMDLSRVTAPAGSQQSRDRRGPAPQAGANRPKGHVRAGFFQAAPSVPEVPAEEDDYSKRKDDKRRVKTLNEGGPAKPAEEGALQHFDASEFRKREMVFQPKKKKNMLSRPAMQTQITKTKASKISQGIRFSTFLPSL
jgi:translation initiation factor IF-2